MGSVSFQRLAGRLCSRRLPLHRLRHKRQPPERGEPRSVPRLDGSKQRRFGITPIWHSLGCESRASDRGRVEPGRRSDRRTSRCAALCSSRSRHEQPPADLLTAGVFQRGSGSTGSRLRCVVPYLLRRFLVRTGSRPAGCHRQGKRRTGFGWRSRRRRQRTMGGTAVRLDPISQSPATIAHVATSAQTTVFAGVARGHHNVVWVFPDNSRDDNIRLARTGGPLSDASPSRVRESGDPGPRHGGRVLGVTF